VIQSCGWTLVLRLGDSKGGGVEGAPSVLVCARCVRQLSWCGWAHVSVRAFWELVHIVGDNLEGQLAPRQEDGRTISDT
jgi:hypothetical protein